MTSETSSRKLQQVRLLCSRVHFDNIVITGGVILMPYSYLEFLLSPQCSTRLMEMPMASPASSHLFLMESPILHALLKAVQMDTAGVAPQTTTTETSNTASAPTEVKACEVTLRLTLC